jgi:hypothetical protein
VIAAVPTVRPDASRNVATPVVGVGSVVVAREQFVVKSAAVSSTE